MRAARAKGTPARNRKKVTRLSDEEKKKRRIKRDHAKLVRSTFRSAGFKVILSICDKEFSYGGVTSDLDDVYVYENIIVFAELTTSQESGVSDHIKKKKFLFDKILSSPIAFVEHMQNQFVDLKEAIPSIYHKTQYEVRLLYCSLNNVKSELKEQFEGVKFFDFSIAKYFESVTSTVRSSGRHELLSFLEIESSRVGERAIAPSEHRTSVYPGSILPEAHSNFGDGFKVVSFYINPGAVLERCYVLRKRGWRSGDSTYQRLIDKKKISSIRKYLVDKERVFINNIIVTLPDDTKLLSGDGDTIDPKSIVQTVPGRVQIPQKYNTIGIIDGQHRVFSYHEGGSQEDKIASLRERQNLLVTGIVFPSSMSEKDRLKFEANLFLEINSNQTNAKSDLKQEINLVIHPFSSESIAKRILNSLNDSAGPLRDMFERYFYDSNKLKTTSIVSFAIRPLVNPGSSSSIFAMWDNDDKYSMMDNADYSLLSEYVAFCAREINHIFAAIKALLPSERWTADKKVASRFLTTTNVNGIIFCLRLLASNKRLYSVREYMELFDGVEEFDFSEYKSSQYNKLSQKLYSEFLE